jgi:hypothetical protein
MTALLATTSRRMLPCLAGLAAVLALTSAAAAEQQFIYPAKGQSSEQQKKDEYECHQWAVQQTGYDPTKPTTTSSAPPPTAAKGSAVKGAVAGAVVGEVVSDNAGAGAAAGAVAGRAASRGQATAQAQQQQQAAAQQAQQKQATYMRARTACLEGRGYTVK